VWTACASGSNGAPQCFIEGTGAFDALDTVRTGGPGVPSGMATLVRNVRHDLFRRFDRVDRWVSMRMARWGTVLLRFTLGICPGRWGR